MVSCFSSIHTLDAPQETVLAFSRQFKQNDHLILLHLAVLGYGPLSITS
jgi:hypothetical protein